MNKFGAWLLPLILSGGVFLLVRPTFAQVIEGESSLLEYLANNDVLVGTDVADGYSQVYYLFEGKKVFIDKNKQNKRQPRAKGEYVVWSGDVNGVGQIYRYHIPSQTLLQITNSSTNLMPQVSKDGQIVWEGWVDEDWQIFFFDGLSTRQLTSGDTSRNPDISGDYISYGRRDITGTWRAVVYSLGRGKAQEVTTGIAAKKPKVRETKIILAGTGMEEEFPLTIEDLFLLDLPPLVEGSEPETVTQEEVIQELETTSQASESGSQVPELDSSGE